MSLKSRRKSFLSYRIENVSNNEEAINFKEFAPFLDKNRSFTERSIWLIAFLICLCTCGSVVYQLIRNFVHTTIVVSVEPSDNGIYGEPFPAVTICNIRKWLVRGVQPDMVNDMINKSISRRSAALPYCSYQNIYYKCEDLMKLTLTDWETFCYTFNYRHPEKYRLPNGDSNFNVTNPILKKFEGYTFSCLVNGFSFMTDVLRQENGGEEAVKLVEVKRYCWGFMVKVHGPEEFPIMTQGSVHVTPGLENNIIVEPFKVVTTPAVFKHPVAYRLRNCYLDGERHLAYFDIYTLSACQMECRLNMSLKKCGCRHWTAPGSPNDKICHEEKELNCYITVTAKMAKNVDKEYGDYLKTCNCKRRCNYSFFKFTVSTALADAEGLSKRFNKSESYYRYNMAIVNVFFGDTTLITYRRDVISTISNLCSSIGGIIGSILGWSLLTIARVVIPAIFGMRFRIRKFRKHVIVSETHNTKPIHLSPTQ
ncbi:hypothetical protein CHUAL_008687 [Chamberlinius hualienensis]